MTAEYVSSLESLINELAPNKVSLVVQVSLPFLIVKAWMYQLILLSFFFVTCG